MVGSHNKPKAKQRFVCCGEEGDMLADLTVCFGFS